MEKSAKAVSGAREMAVHAVAEHGVSIALACRTFCISQTCYRYKRKLADENKKITDWLVHLTDERRTWGFGLCFLYLRVVLETREARCEGFRLESQPSLQDLLRVGAEFADQTEAAFKA